MVSTGTFRLHRGVFNGSDLEEQVRLQENNVIFCLIVLEVHYIYWMWEPNVMHTKLIPATMKERNIVFLQDFLSWNMKWCNKSQCSIFCLIVPNLFKEVLNIIWIQALIMIHTIMAFALSTISQDWNFSLNQLIISFRLHQFTNGFTKTFIRKMRAKILLWSVRLISDIITANEKY